MAKNEAKITFNAETESMTKAIKTINTNLSGLRACLVLNENEFKSTGDKAVYFEQKQQLLSSAISQSKEKQQQLSEKIEHAKIIYGENSDEVQKLKTSLTYAQNEEQKFQTQLNSVNSAIEKNTNQQKESQSAYGSLNSTIEQQEKQLTELKSQYTNSLLEKGKDDKQTVELKNDILKLNSELQENKTALNNAENETKQLTSAEKENVQATESASKGYTTLKNVLANLASNAISEVGSKLKQAAKEVLQSGMDFESSMSNVSALTGATGDELQKLTDKARDVGSTTKFNGKEAADGLGYMALAGWDTNEMLDGYDGIVNLAASSNMDLAESSDIVTDNLSAFNMNAADSNVLVDKMAYAASHSNTDVSQLGEAYKNCAATSTQLGYSLDDTTSSLMVLADSGIKGGEAGTELASIMTRLGNNTGKCQDLLKKYGVEVYDSNGKVKSFSGIVSGMRGVWGKLTDEQKSNLAFTVAGKTAQKGLMTVLGESTGSFDKYNKGLKDCSGSAEKMAGVFQDNLQGDVTTMKSALSDVGLTLYQDLEPPLREAAEFITTSVCPALKEVWNWLEQNKIKIAIVAGVIGGLIVAYGLFNGLLAINSAVNAANATSIAGLVNAKLLEKGAILAGIPGKLADAAATLAMLAPYLLIVAAIAAVIAIGVLLYKNWDTVKVKAIELGEKIKETFTKIKENIANKVNSIKTSIGNGINNVITFIKRPALFVKSETAAILNHIETMKNSAINKFTTLKNKVKDAFNFKFNWPKIKLPKFGVTPSGWKIGDLLKGSIPKLNIEWHKNEGVFKKATLLTSASGHIHGVGEQQPEAIAKISTLMGYVQTAVDQSIGNNQINIDYEKLGAVVSKMIVSANPTIVLNEREIGRAIREVI